MLRTAFPDFRVTLDDQFGEDDRVVSRWTASGTSVDRGPRGVLRSPGSSRGVLVTAKTQPPIAAWPWLLAKEAVDPRLVFVMS
jgi:hypothetical protein